jgi:hypothetical protein
MELKAREAEDDFVYRCGDDEGKVFLELGSHSENEWCCDVNNCAGSQWSNRAKHRQNPRGNPGQCAFQQTLGDKFTFQ